MKIIEQNLVGKTGDPDLCEDAIVISERYVAVIDGATSKRADLIDGKTPGVMISRALSAFLQTQTQDLDGIDLAKHLKEYVYTNLLRRFSIAAPSSKAPSASIAIFTRRSRLITLIGDVQYMINGDGVFKRKNIDILLGRTRSLYLQMLMAEGRTENALSSNDAGREVILPLLQRQYLLRNNPKFGAWAYGEIDGATFAPEFVSKVATKSGDEIVFCSDGYPALLPSLEAAEMALRESLLKDPLRIAEPDTKGVKVGSVSYDDRAYVRFVVD